MSTAARPRLVEVGSQLRQVLPGPPAEVIDVGGGTGQLAVPLAADGWTVTVLDPSAAMLATCVERAAQRGPEAAARLRVIQGDAGQAADLVGLASADAVLCHGVLEVVDDPPGVVAALAGVLRPGGVLSLLAVNRARLATRAARRGDYLEALRLLDDSAVSPAARPRAHPAGPPAVWEGPVGPLAHASRAWTAQELRPWLLDAGLEPVGEYGLGAFAEPPPEAGPEQLAARGELERLAATREPYRSLAKFLHLVARRA